MESLSQDALDQIFLVARSQNGWQPQPIGDDVLTRLHDLMKWGPTSANMQPGRFLFVKSAEAKARLLPCMSPGNVEKTRTAPVVALIAMDQEFYELGPKLFPHADMKSVFKGNAALAEETAFRNSSLQGAYLMLAARALGLDAGPMSGFDKDKLNAAFFAGTTWKANFVCGLGYGDPAKVFPRLPRLGFAEAARIV